MCSSTGTERSANRAFEKYELLIDDLRAVARELGYALGVHGSLARDIDLIAAPWTEQAVSAAELATAIQKCAEEKNGQAFPTPHEDGEYFRAGSPGAKPHGRLNWCFHLGGGPYIDLSVMPRSDITAMEMIEAFWKIPGVTIGPRGDTE
jgi:hypothetical protein